jgi:hypothetical protein
LVSGAAEEDPVGALGKKILSARAGKDVLVFFSPT